MTFNDYCVIQEGIFDKIADYYDVDRDQLKRAAILLAVTWGVIFTLAGIYNYNKLSIDEKKDVDRLRNTSGIEDVIQPIIPNRDLPQIGDLPPLPEQLPVGPPPAAVGNNATADQFFDRLAEEEGFRGTVYDDTGGNPTIGYGHHLDGSDEDQQDVAAALEEADLNPVNYADILHGRATIDRRQARAIFNIDLDRHLNIARRLVPEFDNLPAEVQLALGDAAFRTDLQDSPDAVALMNDDRWIEAAAEYTDNDEYRESQAQGERHGVWQRMDRNAEAFEEYGLELRRRQYNRYLDR